MSHIPNSAMPHAGGINVEGKNGANETAEHGQDGTTLKDRAGRLADKARERPAMAVAAGAAVLGVAAAAAVPLMRGWSSGSSKSGSKSGSSKAKKSS